MVRVSNKTGSRPCLSSIYLSICVPTIPSPITARHSCQHYRRDSRPAAHDDRRFMSLTTGIYTSTEFHSGTSINTRSGYSESFAARGRQNRLPCEALRPTSGMRRNKDPASRETSGERTPADRARGNLPPNRKGRKPR